MRTVSKSNHNMRREHYKACIKSTLTQIVKKLKNIKIRNFKILKPTKTRGKRKERRRMTDGGYAGMIQDDSSCTSNALPKSDMLAAYSSSKVTVSRMESRPDDEHTRDYPTEAVAPLSHPCSGEQIYAGKEDKYGKGIK